MTPVEKAHQLVARFYQTTPDDRAGLAKGYNAWNHAKECALIAVDEIIGSSPSLPEVLNGGAFTKDVLLSNWREVKECIKEL